MRSLFARDAETAPAMVPAAETAAAGGWDGMRGGVKLLLGGAVVAGVVAAVVLPGMGQRQPQQLQGQEPRPPARINDYEPPPSRDMVQDVANKLGLGPLTGTGAGAPVRRRVPTEMALYAPATQPGAGASSSRAVGGEIVPGGPLAGADGADPDDRQGPALVLAATDPANAYGAALPWPERAPRDEEAPADSETGRAAGGRKGHQPGRKADRAGLDQPSTLRPPRTDFRHGGVDDVHRVQHLARRALELEPCRAQGFVVHPRDLAPGNLGREVGTRVLGDGVDPQRGRVQVLCDRAERRTVIRRPALLDRRRQRLDGLA